MKHEFGLRLIMGLLMGAMIACVSVQSAAGQIDRERMDRDIRIMNSALEELFKTDTPHQRIQIGARGSISGSYLPGFGVVFTIPDRTRTPFFTFSTGDRDDDTLFFAHPLGDNNKSITEPSVKNRITEFLVNYASSIGQLESGDRVMVIYGTQFADGRRISLYGGEFIFHSEAPRKNPEEASEAPNQLPIISMSVTRQDLDDFRTGRISQDEFQSRISVATQKRDDVEQKLDLQVFARVLETGLNENREELFRLRGKPMHLYLDNFGVIYQMNLGRSAGLLPPDFNIRLNENLQNIQQSLPSFQIDMDGFQAQLDSINIDMNIGLREMMNSEELRKVREQIRQEMEKAGEEIQRAREEYREQLPEIRRQQEETLQQLQEKQRELREELEKHREQASEQIHEEMEKAKEEIQRVREEYREQLPEIRRQQEEARQQLQEKQQELRGELEKHREQAGDPEKMRESLERQLNVIRELMVDYGRTLSSLGDDHSLFLIVNVQQSAGELPKRIDLRISKEDLNRLERGQISRAQAIERIVERRL